MMMAERCFEVAKLEIRFCRTNGNLACFANSIIKEITSYLQQHVADISINQLKQMSHPNIVIAIEFSKCISVNTVIQLLTQIYAHERKMHGASYDLDERKITAYILK